MIIFYLPLVIIFLISYLSSSYSEAILSGIAIYFLFKTRDLQAQLTALYGAVDQKTAEAARKDYEGISSLSSPQESIEDDPQAPFKVARGQEVFPQERFEKDHSAPVTNISHDAKKNEPVESAELSEAWDYAESWLLQNWVGVLGAGALVAGVGFLGVYTALKVVPFLRFCIISAFSALLLGTCIIVRRSAQWEQLGFLLGSVGASSFLIACLGAGGITGLQWTEDPLQGLLVLCSGLFINLCFACFSGKQVFYVTHLLLSLMALAFAPATFLTLLVAIITTVVYILLSFSRGWDVHYLVSIAGFFLYNYWSCYQLKQLGNFTLEYQYLGLAGTFLVGGLIWIIHFQKIYTTLDATDIGLLTHTGNILFIGAGTILFRVGFIHCSILLAIASLVLFGSAWLAQRRTIRLLYTTDMIIGQLLALGALASLYEFAVSYSLIFSALFVQSLLFYSCIRRGNDELLKIFSVALVYCTELSMFFGTLAVIQQATSTQLMIAYALLAGSFLLGLWFFFEHRTHRLLEAASVFIFTLPALLLFQLAVNDATYVLHWQAIIAGLLLLPAVMKQYVPQSSMTCANGLLLLVFTILTWLDKSFVGNGILLHQLYKAGVLVLLLFVNGYFSGVRSLGARIAWPYVYLAGLSGLVLSFQVLCHHSSILLGIDWLISSLLLLELSLLLRSSRENGYLGEHVYHVGLLFIGGFIALHLAYHLQIEAIIGLVSIRLLIQLLAIATCAYWLARERDTQSFSLAPFVQPFFLEFTLATVVLAIALEVPYIYLAPSWGVLGVIVMIMSKLLPKRHNRLLVYSLLLVWNAGIHLASVTSHINYPSVIQLWGIGLGIILVQLMYLLIFTLHNGFAGVQLPKALGCLTGLVNTVTKKSQTWVFYPFFITVALFFFWRLDRSFLTLSWMVEVFGIFLLGILFKDKYFRSVSLGMTLICAIRLVFYDLAQVDTLMRGIVFVVFGATLIAMHALHNYFNLREQQ